MKLFIFLLFILIEISGQFRYKLKAEAGFNNSATNLYSRSDILLRGEGLLEYRISDENKSALAQIKAQPGVYGGSSDISFIRYNAKINYQEMQNSFSWGTEFSYKKNNFSFPNQSYFNDLYFLNANLTYFTSDVLNLKFNVGFAKQLSQFSFKQNLNILFQEIKLIKSISSSVNIGGGIYVEKFNIENSFSIKGESSIKNEGWRYGPQIDINYLQDFICQLEYKLLLHDSKLEKVITSEHWVRLVAGKILAENWSVFLMADYNKRKISATHADEKMEYIPFNSANDIYLKIGHSLSETTEVFLKYGYYKEILPVNNFRFEGWNLMIGIEISK